MRHLALLAALAASPALAVDIPAPRPVANAGAAAAANSTAAAWSASRSYSGSVAGATGGASFATGGTASIAFNAPGEVRYDFGGGVKTVPDAIASIIERQVLAAIDAIQKENAELRHARGVLTRRLHIMGYDGPMEVGEHKRKLPRLRAQAERMNR